jgi:hypothetical protein
MLPSPNSLPDKDYSLIPDMALGWAPKMRSMVVKLSFEVMTNDEILGNELTIY